VLLIVAFTLCSFCDRGLRGTDILVENMTILANVDSCDGYAGAPNTDGVNIGGQRIRVRNVFVHNRR